MKKSLLSFAVVLLLALLSLAQSTPSARAAGARSQGAAASTVTTVFLVRHAEKSAAPPEDPSLSPEGRARAARLAAMLAPAKLSAIFTTKYARSRETAGPLAERNKVALSVVDGLDASALAARILRDHAGTSVCVVGHTNTIPQLIEALGAGAIDPIAETAFDDFFIVTVRRGAGASVVRLKYPG